MDIVKSDGNISSQLGSNLRVLSIKRSINLSPSVFLHSADPDNNLTVNSVRSLLLEVLGCPVRSAKLHLWQLSALLNLSKLCHQWSDVAAM